MGHLLKDLNGHLWKAPNGHLVNECREVLPCIDCLGVIQPDVAIVVNGVCPDQAGCDGAERNYTWLGDAKFGDNCIWTWLGALGWSFTIGFNAAAELWSGTLSFSGSPRLELLSGDIPVKCDTNTNFLTGQFNLFGVPPQSGIWGDCRGCIATVTLGG